MALRDRLRRTLAGVRPTSDARAVDAGPSDGTGPRLPVDTSLETASPVVEPGPSGAFDAVVTVAEGAYRDGAHVPTVRALTAAGAARVVVTVYDVHAGPTSTYPPVTAGDGWTVSRDTVAATWGGAVAAARPLLRAPLVLVQDASIALPDGAAAALVAAVAPAGAGGTVPSDREAVVAVPVVRTPDDVVASAGAALVQGTAPVAALLRGHPAEDAERLPDGVAVFAGDEPCFAARTAHLALPVRTVDTRTAVARLTRDTADAAGGTCVVLPLGRVYRTGTVRERRIDTDGADALAVWRDRGDDSAERVLAALELAVGTVAADPAAAPVALREPVLRAERGPSRLTARERGERLRWSVRIAAHPGPRGDDWGDTFFARDLAAALRSLGQEVVVDHRESHARPLSEHLDDVTLTLRGLDDTPVHPSATNVLWVISHPDLVTPAELARYDLRFAAGPVWAERTEAATGLPVAPLLQATDPARFHPGAAEDAYAGLDTVFVGKTRQVFRPVVSDALQAGADLAVWGEGWAGLVPEGVHRGTFVPNEDLPALYRSARVVLNDHWDDMARDGFLSNRLFDAAASGALVVTDPVPGVEELFGGAVLPYRGVAELRTLLGRRDTASDDERAERGARIGTEHSFRRRAETLVDAVRQYRQHRTT
ncbi:glycosyltransferase [Curtobacterium sp. MCBD17_008]|uniref:CgeB family protein n=1 Tax=Curtobacterium sp. MCBD17_008 TaxID=2175656 RepID=UPI000DA6FBEC|nr:glycosyltransferase [Curtobacterium sp. MCBD17_008]PZE95781.1 hypothetical protein DEI95_00025 [Curtobacterium sp. MCBD17_008]